MSQSRVETLLEQLDSEGEIKWESQSRVEECLVACINKTGKAGCSCEPQSRVEELLQVHAEQCANMSGGGDGTAMLVSTAEEMDTLLVEENLGKIYKFVGVTDETYTNGQYYIIEEAE